MAQNLDVIALGRLGGRPLLLVGGMTTLFAIGSSTIGMAEEYMPFIPILVTLSLALKMDAMVALGIVYIGAGVGYGGARARGRAGERHVNGAA